MPNHFKEEEAKIMETPKLLKEEEVDKWDHLNLNNGEDSKDINKSDNSWVQSLRESVLIVLRNGLDKVIKARRFCSNSFMESYRTMLQVRKVKMH